MKVTYTEEAIADIVEAISYLHERNPTAAAKVDADIARCIEPLADREFEGPVSPTSPRMPTAGARNAMSPPPAFIAKSARS